MYKIIEVVGISPESFSKAAEQAVNKIVEAGNDVKYFTLEEQRGLVKEGRVVEFQAILKIAVSEE